MKDYLLAKVNPGLPTMVTGLIAAVLGVVFAGVIITEKMLLAENEEYVTSCSWNPVFSCSDVMTSWQASFFGPVPNPVVGLIGFTAVLSFFLLSYFHNTTRSWWVVQTVGLALALVFCFWLAVQAIFVIQAICIYCVGVWVMTSLLFTLSVRQLIPKEWRGLAWAGFAVMLVAFAGMMFAGFTSFWLHVFG